MEIYDPPLGGLVDVKVHGYDMVKGAYLVRIESEPEPILIPAKDVHVEDPSWSDDLYTEFDYEDSQEG